MRPVEGRIQDLPPQPIEQGGFMQGLVPHVVFLDPAPVTGKVALDPLPHGLPEEVVALEPGPMLVETVLLYPPDQGVPPEREVVLLAPFQVPFEIGCVGLPFHPFVLLPFEGVLEDPAIEIPQGG